MVRYFLKTATGEKGPYSKKQILAAHRAGQLSPSASYRVAGEAGGSYRDGGSWRPVSELVGAAKAEVLERELRAREAYEEALPDDFTLPTEPTPPWVRAVVGALICGAVAGGLGLYRRATARDGLGRACTSSSDCPNGACMFPVDDQRNLQPVGYCTAPCSDDADCPGMRCEYAADVANPPAGKRWDGMLGKSHRMCARGPSPASVAEKFR